MELTKEEFQRLERKSAGQSVGITLLVTLLLMTLGLWWTAMTVSNPPVTELAYIELYNPETEAGVGTGGGGQMQDYGNLTEGSSNINNTFAPAPTPPGRSNTNTASPSSPDDAQADPVATDPNSQSGVSASPSRNPNRTLDDDGSFDGGSNHGHSDQIGNAGNPNSQTLDPDGNVEGNNLGHGHGDGIGDGIGNGIEGSTGGRKIKNWVPPVYSSSQDAKIKFTFKVDEDGNVVWVGQPDTPHQRLAQAGIDAIRNWKFEPLKEGDHRTTEGWVTITFFRK